MGDRCWLNIIFRRDDLPAFEKILGRGFWNSENEAPEGVLDVEIWEANYGWYEERQTLAKQGLAFFGRHGEGGEYGPCLFAAADGRMDEVQADHEGYPVVRVDDGGEVGEGDLRQARAYLERLTRANALIGITAKREAQNA